MPVVFEANSDGTNSRWYKHHSLVRFYLDQAYTFSLKARDEHFEGAMMASSIIGILFSAMSLEAFCNETAEDIISEHELNDFQFCRGRFKARNSSAVSKLDYLFSETFEKGLPVQLKQKATNIFSIRNNLSHYKLSEMATVYEGPTIGNRSENPKSPLIVDFEAEVKKTNPALVERITGVAAVESFNTALDIITEWGKRKGLDDNVPGLSTIS